MNLSGLSLCARARVLLPRLVAGRVSDAALARHVGTCPRCRPGLRAARAQLGVPASRAEDPTAYVLAVVQAAGRERLGALLEELARACAALAPASGGAPRARVVGEVRADVQRLMRRLGTQLDARDRSCPTAPDPVRALGAARACLAAAERVAGTTPERQLHRAACALAADDRTAASALCSGLVAQESQASERARLARSAAGVARAWGLPAGALGALLRQPAPAGCN
jgi:hypothetical protein